MSRYDDDLLMRLAFGEAEDAERERLVGELTPEALRRMRRFEAMRGGLASLSDIPDHQLSSERLRQRILGAGLKPAGSNAPRWGWLWAPAATAVATFAIAAALLHRPAVEPMVASNTKPLKLPMSEERVKLPSVMSAPEVTVDNPPPVAAGKVDTPLLRAPQHRQASGMIAMATTRREDDLEARHFAERAPRPQPVLEPMPARDSGEPLVLIAQEADDTTGAQLATEVESSNDVVIGG